MVNVGVVFCERMFRSLFNYVFVVSFLCEDYSLFLRTFRCCCCCCCFCFCLCEDLSLCFYHVSVAFLCELCEELSIFNKKHVFFCVGMFLSLLIIVFLFVVFLCGDLSPFLRKCVLFCVGEFVRSLFKPFVFVVFSL